MRTTLTDFVSKHYELGYLGDSFNKKRKLYLEFNKRNLEALEQVVNQYTNIKLVHTYSQYAPELKKVFVTLK
jgi:hypothetical protein